MTATKTGASRSRGASARSGLNGKGKTVKFRDLTLTLPPKAPGDLVFSLADGEVSVALKEVFGLEQYQAIRAACSQADLSIEEVLRETDELLGRALIEWGTGPGE